MVIVAGCTSLYPIAIDYAFNILAEKDLAGLTLVPIIIILLTFVKGVAFFYQSVVAARISTRVITNIQKELYSRLISLDLAFVSNKRVGELQSRLLNDVNLLRETIVRSLNNLVRDLLTLIGLIASMFYLDWALTIAVILVYPICVWPILIVGRINRKLATRFQEQLGQVNSFLNESFSGLRLIKAFGLEKLQKLNGNKYFESLFDVTLKMSKTRARLEPILEVIGGLAIAIVIFIAGTRIINGTSDIGAFSGFISALLIAVQPARALGTLNTVLQEGASAGERIVSSMGSEGAASALRFSRQVAQGQALRNKPGAKLSSRPSSHLMSKAPSSANARLVGKRSMVVNGPNRADRLGNHPDHQGLGEVRQRRGQWNRWNWIL